MNKPAGKLAHAYRTISNMEQIIETQKSSLESNRQAVQELVEGMEAAMNYIGESPCDPDITSDQWAAWQTLQDLNVPALIAKHGGTNDR